MLFFFFCQYCIWQFLLLFMKESTCYVSCTLWKCAALAVTLDGFAVVIKTQMELISFPSVWLADTLWSTLLSAEHVGTICLQLAWRGWLQRNFLIITWDNLNRVYSTCRSHEIVYKGFHDSQFAIKEIFINKYFLKSTIPFICLKYLQHNKITTS